MSKFRYFPVSYDVGDKPVLVIGDGAAALNKLRLLIRSTARLTVFAPDASTELTDFAAEKGVFLTPRHPIAEDLIGAALAFVATGDLTTDRRFADLSRAAGVPVNVVDRPALSDFATPAIVDRAPISIAIATDGHAPVLAQKLRGMIEASLAPNFGRLADLAAELRARAAALGRLPDAAARRGFWARVFDGPAGEAALRGEPSRAIELGLKELDTPSPASGTVFLIDRGPGDADLLTLRAHRILLIADLILHDADAPEAILAMARRDAVRTNEPRAGLAAIHARRGERVVWLTMGGPTRAELGALAAAGVAFEIIPGVPAPRRAALREAA